MKCTISGKEYTYTTKVKYDPKIKDSFNVLAKKTFDLEFEDWGSDYIPHVLLDGDVVVANVSVNSINIKYKSELKHYIQLGTIMTDSDYRGRGLSRWLIEKVISIWSEASDAIYLFANDSVLDFYPKFGFVKANEYQCKKTIYKEKGKVKKLNMECNDDVELLLSKYALSNPFSALKVVDNTEILMFYCTRFMREDIYYLEEYEVVAIAEYSEGSMVVYDAFGNRGFSLEDILSTLSREDKVIAYLGFYPENIEGYEVCDFHEEDTTLFVLKDKENIFSTNKLMFPLLSHA